MKRNQTRIVKLHASRMFVSSSRAPRQLECECEQRECGGWGSNMPPVSSSSSSSVSAWSPPLFSLGSPLHAWTFAISATNLGNMNQRLKTLPINGKKWLILSKNGGEKREPGSDLCLCLYFVDFWMLVEAWMFRNVSNRFELMDGFTTKAGSCNRDRDGRRSISSFGVTKLLPRQRQATMRPPRRRGFMVELVL